MVLIVLQLYGHKHSQIHSFSLYRYVLIVQVINDLFCMIILSCLLSSLFSSTFDFLLIKLFILSYASGHHLQSSFIFQDVFYNFASYCIRVFICQDVILVSDLIFTYCPHQALLLSFRCLYMVVALLYLYSKCSSPQNYLICKS